MWLRRIAFVLMFVLLSFSGAILSVCTIGRATYRWHGFAVEVRLLPSSIGETRLVLAPLGEVQAHTHNAPVTLVASLEAIQIEEIRKLLDTKPDREALAQDFERSAKDDLRNFVTRQIAAAALGSLIAPLFMRSRRFRAWGSSVLMGVLLVGMVLGSALTTFNGKAFETPEYTGALKQAPWVIQFGKDAFTKIEALSQKLRTVASNLNVLYGRITALPDRLVPDDGPDTFHILHVSDIHNNPAALDFIQEVAHQFHVEMIVDTGDLTDFGSPPETVIVQGIGKLGYPYVFVAGNHDSRVVVEALKKVSNVVVLEGKPLTIHGVTLLGLPNPASLRAGVGSVDTTPQELQTGGETLLHTLQGLPSPPDIVALHDPEEARPLWGYTPLILCGHEHRYYIQQERGQPTSTTPEIRAPGTGMTPVYTPAWETVICNAGTTGAAGLRYVDRKEGVPFSCAVLTFRRVPAQASSPPDSPASTLSSQTASASSESRAQLRAIDQIVLNGSLHEYSISHHTFHANEPPTPAAVTAAP